MNTLFWNGKRVFLTGHTGFKGSWLSLWLQQLGAKVTGFSKFIPTNPSLFKIAGVEDGMASITGDVCDFDGLKKALERYKPEIIIHMAAQSLVRQSYEDPVGTFATNVMGTVNLLESAKHVKDLHAIINVTSDKCYENKDIVNHSFKEDEPMGGYDPYSNSKGCAELVTSCYRDSFFNIDDYENHGISIATVRAGNVIGGGDWSKDRLIPDIIRGITNNTPVKIRHPQSVRPWQFVLEPLGGYLLLAERLWENGSKYSGAWNFGPNDNDAKSVKWIIDEFTKKWRDEIKFEIDLTVHPHEANFLRLDWAKAKNELDWSPKTDLETSISLTTEWFKKYQSKENMRKFTEEQIRNFGSL